MRERQSKWAQQQCEEPRYLRVVLRMQRLECPPPAARSRPAEAITGAAPAASDAASASKRDPEYFCGSAHGNGWRGRSKSSFRAEGDGRECNRLAAVGNHQSRMAPHRRGTSGTAPRHESGSLPTGRMAAGSAISLRLMSLSSSSWHSSVLAWRPSGVGAAAMPPCLPKSSSKLVQELIEPAMPVFEAAFRGRVGGQALHHDR